jgi:predicted RNA methylase
MKIWSVAKIRRITRGFLNNPIAYSSSCITLLIALIQEKKIGIETYGYSFPKDNINLYGDATPYTATSYSRLNKMINYLKLSKEDVFIDLGCGAGRPIFLVGTRRLKKVIGVEIRKELADIARRNLGNLKLNNTPIEIIHTDASVFDVKEGTVFFMFNPFGEKTFTKVIENIKKSLVTDPRKVRIVYYCSVYKDLLDSQDWLVSEGEIDKTDIFVWHSKLN